ncbi:MAG: hypothetical protein ACI4QN_03750 [Candidatus Coproplasma sp.]
MKKLTKLLSVFLIAGAVGTGVAGISACSTKEPETPEHEHTAATEWQSDANGHWHNCTADDGAKLDAGAHVWDNDQDTTCNTCGYVRTVTPPPATGYVIPATADDIIVEGYGDADVQLSPEKTSHAIDKSAIKVYLSANGVKGDEVPAENLEISIKDPTNHDCEWSNLKVDGAYKISVSVINATVADGSDYRLDDFTSTKTVTVHNAIVANSLAVKEGATLTQVQGANIMTSTWTYEVTRENGEKEDVSVDDVVVGTIDTNSVGENKTVAISLKSNTNVTGTVTYTITADETKVMQSYVLNFNNWTSEQEAAVSTSSDASPIVINDIFTVVAGMGAIANENTEGEGLLFTKRLKFGGKTTDAGSSVGVKELDKQRYIKVTAADAGTLTIYAYSNTGTAPADGALPTVCTTRKVAIYSSRTAADGTNKATYSGQVGTSQDTYEKYISIHTFELPEAGEYYIVAEGGDICFTYVRLDMRRTPGAGIEEVKAPTGTDELVKISVSTATADYKQTLTVGSAFTVDSEYTIKGVVANNVTGVVASNGAITEGITYWLGETQLIPGETTMDVLGNNTITVKVGSLSATYTVVVSSAVDGITGINASDTLAGKQVDTASDTIAFTKNDIKIDLVGVNAGASVTSYTVKVDGVALTDTVNLIVGTHTVEVTAKVEAGTQNAEFTDTFTITISVKAVEGALNNVVVDSTIVSTVTGTLTAETVLVDNANGKVFITAATDKTVVVEADAKTYGDNSFTHRIKLGGTGAVANRSIGIEVKQGATIVVYAISSSGSAARDVKLMNADGTTATATGTLDGGAMGQVDGAALHKVEYTVTAAGTYYFCSAASGLNVYGVEIIYS